MEKEKKRYWGEALTPLNREWRERKY